MLRIVFSLSILIMYLFGACEQASHSLAKWEKLTLTFEGPQASEQDSLNPFLDYRLNVTFSHKGKEMLVPGFYAADGNAAESSADVGNIWKVRFRPDELGDWTYTVSFRKGKNIAISDDPLAGEAVAFDGQTGSIQVTEPLKYKEGRLHYIGTRYLSYAESKRPFLKAGADSPENFLGYVDFDGTMKGEAPIERSGEATAKEALHTYEPHIRDWQEGDPTWKDGKGKGMIGALNYLASKGMNSVYFLTMNINGDGKDVWPYTGYDERFRFDCSKLDQWEIVFDHMDHLGLMLHIVLQETENEMLLDSGDTGMERKLYYRELIARFAHHLGVTWNMGEENGPAHWTPFGQNMEQQKAMVAYLKTHDPYKNFLVIHSHADNKTRYALFDKLLGNSYLDGISLQIGDIKYVHHETQSWIGKSAEAGRQWVVNMDEIGPHFRGVDPDDREDNNQDTVRALALWGNLMSGGGGAEWYFGYRNHNNDLDCEDWRSRDRMWDQTRYAIEFFHKYLPFKEMQNHDGLAAEEGVYCFAKPGDTYAMYMPIAGGILDMEENELGYTIDWYDPRNGGEIQKGSILEVKGGKNTFIGLPPKEKDKDWVALIRRK